MVAPKDVEVVEENGLEQREPKASRKAKADPEANGHANGHAAEQVPEDEVVEEELGEEPPPDGSRLYFVRVPRPPQDETLIKRLQQEFQAHVAKVKTFNAKIAAKREESRELRKQMNQAKALKETSQPEFDDKSSRLRQLKDMRQDYNQKMGAIRENLKGLDCKSEEELENKIRELEHKVSHEALALREEKQIVQQISKLNAQRSKVREYDSHKSTLTELEGDSSKVRAVISELEAEVNILKAERDSAQKIITEIWNKLQAVDADAKELEQEQAEAVKAKNDALEALNQAREEMDVAMKDYRENRKFSLQVRDMVAANQIEEARALCQEQVETMLGRIAEDNAFRAEYFKLWSTQRKAPVSELLPHSAPSSSSAAPAKGAKAAAGKSAPPPLQGKEKAQSIIAAIMEQAKQKASQQAARQVDSDHEDPEPSDEPEPVEVAKPLEPSKPAAVPKPAKPAEVFKVQLPDIKDEGFELPDVVKAEADGKAASDAEARKKLLDEQKAKAAEAEARKKRQAEQREKKKLLAQQKAVEQAKKEASKPVPPAPKVSEPVSEPEPELSSTEAKVDPAPSTSKAAVKPKTKDAAIILKTQTTVAAKRPKDEKLTKQIKKLLKQYSVLLTVLGFALFMFFIVLVFMK